MDKENDFLKIARHQLKGPVTLIKGYLSFWQNDDYQKFSAAKQKELINKAMASAEKLNILINDVFLALSLEGKEDLKINPEPVQLKELIEAVYNENFKDSYENKGLYLKIEANEDSLIINSDKHYLTLVFRKLLDNAEKYTESGGITVFLQKENKYASIEIRGIGSGFTAEEKSLLFTKFFHGSLGLYLAKEIVNALNGEISAESAGQNQGAKFIIKLPF
ncbi:MAG: HAMP domain-containing sensor histidine kinase [Patescibacteria group bacterium]|mgnify:FL=1